MKMPWDRSVIYEDASKKISKHLTEMLQNLHGRNLRRAAFDSALLIAVRNLSRIGEAIMAFQKLHEGTPEVMVLVEKHRKTDERLMVFPQVILKNATTLTKLVSLLPNDRNTKAIIYHYSMRVYGFNPHSLRYSGITKMSKRGVQSQIIAKVTQHRSDKEIKTYIQQKTADDILRDLDKEV